MRKIFYALLQCTWGILQTLAGFVIFLINIKCEHHFFHGCVVTSWKMKAGLSLGEFIFISDDPFCYYPDAKGEYSYEEFYSLYEVHEYGHTIQSLIFGPLYLLVVGLVSLLWAWLPVFQKKRERQNLSYFAVFPENQANWLGEKTTGKKSPGQIV